jgi:hypothetical protein
LQVHGGERVLFKASETDKVVVGKHITFFPLFFHDDIFFSQRMDSKGLKKKSQSSVVPSLPFSYLTHGSYFSISRVQHVDPKAALFEHSTE